MADRDALDRLAHATPLSRLWHLLGRYPGHFTPLEKLVAFTIVGYMQRDGTGAFPSTNTIARRAEVSRRSVARALHGLTKGPAPILALKHRRRGSSVYALVTDPGAFAAGRDRTAVIPFSPDAWARCATAKASQVRVVGKNGQRRRQAPEDADAARVLATIRAQAAAMASGVARDDPPAECACGALTIRRTTATGTIETYNVDPNTYQVAGLHTCHQGAAQASPAG